MLRYTAIIAAEDILITAIDEDDAVYQIKSLVLKELNDEVEFNIALGYNERLQEVYEFIDMIEDADTIQWLKELSIFIIDMD